MVSETCTALISFGVVKDHDLAGVSAGLKNWYGVIHNPNKYHDHQCDPYVADVVKHPFIRDKLKLTVLDGVIAQYHGGPAFRASAVFPLGLLAASIDPVAADLWAWKVHRRRTSPTRTAVPRGSGKTPAFHRDGRGLRTRGRRPRRSCRGRGAGVSLDRRRFAALLACGAAAAGSPRATGAGRAVSGSARSREGRSYPAREASWYKKLEEGRIECQLCPQACTVADAERGTCGARENRGGTYYTLVHSLACSIHADPIEKKPFFHVMPGELALSYATAGCNVECKFCQNWEISQFRPEQVRSVYLPPEALVEAARRAGARLTAATYSEPVIFWEYVRDTARAAKKAGLAPTVVSNGFIQEAPLREVLPLLDAVKIDLKSFREEFYRDQLRGRLEPVLKALEIIRGAGVWLEIVVLLIPTLNDSEGEVRDLSKWVKTNLGPDVPHPFHPVPSDLPSDRSSTDPGRDRSRGRGRSPAPRVSTIVYLGNLPTHPAENTVCPGCGEVLIRRLGFKILENRLTAGCLPGLRTDDPGRLALMR